MMNQFSLLGVTQGLASMVAQNTNAPLPDVIPTDDGVCRFVAETAAGWVRVTVEPVEWADGQPYTPEPVYGGADEQAHGLGEIDGGDDTDDDTTDDTDDDTDPMPDSAYPLIANPVLLRGLGNTLEILRDELDNDTLVPERWTLELAGELADLDHDTVTAAIGLVRRLARWATFPDTASSYVEYRKGE